MLIAFITPTTIFHMRFQSPESLLMKTYQCVRKAFTQYNHLTFPMHESTVWATVPLSLLRIILCIFHEYFSWWCC